ncbi:putative glycoside hydrolase [Cavenderia fasciculata]|uniref:Endoglucanase n=1 Tax=Cavenderia fasciculata TaxID=261658 RepID=F4PK43_CACFS|nr:putative glycoside hydrolase [Cavenderia fasciculata]EGG23967.1 putative glycoside hydrolase [Cavenderia fasciculata]|eukprot:XP_004361818.1 putative glycoside hydrolase [Cavenderia fasciculata]
MIKFITTIAIIFGILILPWADQAQCSVAVSCDLLKQGLMFYKANRGGRLPDTDVPWRNNSVLSDAYPAGAKDANGDGNLSGGYFDAGDGIKVTLPMSYSMTMLAWGFLESEAKIEACGLTNLYLETIKWGTDWLMAAHVSDNELVCLVGDPNADHSWWGPPELMTMERPVYVLSASKPGTEVAMEVAAALAATAVIYKDRDAAYAESCLSHAKSVFTFGENNLGVYSESYPIINAFYKSWSGYKDEMVWAAAWMYKATGDESYLTKAKEWYTTNGIATMGAGTTMSWDNKAPGTMVLMSKITNDTSYAKDAATFLDGWMPGGSVPYTPGGLAWLMEWGPNRYAINTAFIAQALGDAKYITGYTDKQLAYVLGDNPNQQSFVVGVGNKHPINPHHRAAHGSTTNNIKDPVNNIHMLYGALVGGPGKDDAYTDDRENYITNEVATDYNACFVAVLAYYAAGNETTTPTSSETVCSSEEAATVPPVTPASINKIIAGTFDPTGSSSEVPITNSSSSSSSFEGSSSSIDNSSSLNGSSSSIDSSSSLNGSSSDILPPSLSSSSSLEPSANNSSSYSSNDDNPQPSVVGDDSSDALSFTILVSWAIIAAFMAVSIFVLLS